MQHIGAVGLIVWRWRKKNIFKSRTTSSVEFLAARQNVCRLSRAMSHASKMLVCKFPRGRRWERSGSSAVDHSSGSPQRGCGVIGVVPFASMPVNRGRVAVPHSFLSRTTSQRNFPTVDAQAIAHTQSDLPDEWLRERPMLLNLPSSIMALKMRTKRSIGVSRNRVKRDGPNS